VAVRKRCTRPITAPPRAYREDYPEDLECAAPVSGIRAVRSSSFRSVTFDRAQCAGYSYNVLTTISKVVMLDRAKNIPTPARLTIPAKR
jgi:hypothetical protein